MMLRHILVAEAGPIFSEMISSFIPNRESNSKNEMGVRSTKEHRDAMHMGRHWQHNRDLDKTARREIRSIRRWLA
jgi:hypothetical protein